MYVSDIHYRCLPKNCFLPNHVTYDCGTARKVDKAESNINVGTLQEIVMVEYGLLYIDEGVLDETCYARPNHN